MTTTQPYVQELNVLPGTSLLTATEICLSYVRNRPNALVTLDFNGVPLFVTMWDTSDSVMARYDKLQTVFWVIYTESDSYKKDKQAAVAKVTAQQQQLDALLAELPTRTKQASLVNWVNELANISDDMRLVWDKQAVATFIRTLGYSADMFVGLGNDAYLDKSTAAGYIIGQALAALEDDLPPHPSLRNFVDTYNKLPN